MRILYLGFAISDEMFSTVLETDRGLPVQTHRFGWSVIEALQSAGADVDPISLEPVADYPHNSRMFVEGRSFEERGVQGRSASFVNITGLKHLTRYVATLRAARRVARDQPADAVLIHGVHSPLLWVGLRLGRSLGIPVVTIMTDAPSLRTRYDNPLTVAMKKVDRRLIVGGLARMEGVVALAPRLAEDFAPGLPVLWMEGIAPTLPELMGPDRRSEGTVVYAGGLHATYGVQDLVDAVGCSAGTWRLDVYGRGPAEDLVRAAAARSPRIRYGGTVGSEELVEIYAAADLLVNPRPPDSDLAQYSFPSKVLEYLATGTPVLTTRLPNLPADYEQHLFLAEPGASGLAQAIDEVMCMEPALRLAIGSAAREFIRDTRGPTAQGERLVQFLTGRSRR